MPSPFSQRRRALRERGSLSLKRERCARGCLRGLTAASSLLGLLVACAASAAPTAAPAAARKAPAQAEAHASVAAVKPFLSAASEPQVTSVLPPAPVAGTPRYEADRAVFRATRWLEGSTRWALAVHDVDTSVAATLGDFSCAMGRSLDPARAPHLAALLERLKRDAGQISGPAKKANHRQRPFQIDSGAVCQPVKELAHSFDYPSGHATWGWTTGLVLAELAPDRATDILLRARGFAESRVICGAHNLTAIQAGATTAASLVAALHASPEFVKALAQARTELDTLRTTAPRPDAQRCADELELISATPY